MVATERLQVAAGILVDEQGRILLTERIGDSPFAGLWEFPGGKRHGSESAEQAVCRELREELDVDVLAAHAFMSVQHDYDDRRVDIDFFLITDWQRTPRSCDGQALRWSAPRDIDTASLLPADGPVIEALQRELSDGTQPA